MNQKLAAMTSAHAEVARNSSAAAFNSHAREIEHYRSGDNAGPRQSTPLGRSESTRVPDRERHHNQVSMFAWDRRLSETLVTASFPQRLEGVEVQRRATWNHYFAFVLAIGLCRYESCRSVVFYLQLR